MRRITYIIGLVLISSLTWAEKADFKIVIPGGVTKGRPIAVAPFVWKGRTVQPPQDIADVVSFDLLRSGLFEPKDKQLIQPFPKPGDTVINYHKYRKLNVEYLIYGSITEVGNRYSIRVILVDIFKQKSATTSVNNVSNLNLRMQAHAISDWAYKEMTGIKGAFATRLAYVSHRPGSKLYRLMVADSDGENRKEVLSSSSPILSPTWSRDGKYLAYALKKKYRWEVILQNVYTAKQRVLSNMHAGLKNATSMSAPSFSPDGTKLAFAMSKNRNYDIYVVGVNSGYFKRVTTHYEVDTEPAWIDDKTLVFTSGRGGNPQIYRKSINGGTAKRMTYEGKYNARPTVSPGGKYMGFVHGIKNSYYIALMDLERDVLNIVSKSKAALYESPSFSPNGQWIVYTAGKQRGRFTPLAVVSVDGRANYKLEATIKGDIREPAWSNYLSN